MADAPERIWAGKNVTEYFVNGQKLSVTFYDGNWSATKQPGWTEYVRADWRPIDTAPRDGTPFLTFSRDAADDPRESALGYKSTPTVVMGWIPGDDRPFPIDEHGNWADWHCYEPTHWMPLPPYP